MDYSPTFWRHCGLTLLLILTAGCKKEQTASSSEDAENANLLKDPPVLLTYIETIRHSKPLRAQSLATRAYSNPSLSFGQDWRWRFHMLYAAMLLDVVKPDEAEKLVNVPPPAAIPASEAVARIADLRGYLEQRNGALAKAEGLYQMAIADLNAIDDPCWRAELLVHQTSIANQQNQPAYLRELLSRTTPYTEKCGDKAWAVSALIWEAVADNDQMQYETALALLHKAVTLAGANGLSYLTNNALANIALVYSNLGDFESAVLTFNQIDDYFRSLAQPTERDLREWGGHIGHRARTYLALGRYKEAEADYLRAIELCDTDFQARYRAELASLYIAQGNLNSAQALNAKVDVTGHDPPTEALARLNLVKLARLNGHLSEAQAKLAEFEPKLRAVPETRNFLWQFQSEDALVEATLNRIPAARHRFEESLATAESARSSIKADQYRLTYFLPLLDIYRKYVDFLTAHNQPDQALHVAELGRARLLAEKLQKTPQKLTNVNFTSLARAKNAIITFLLGRPAKIVLMRLLTLSASQIFDLPAESVLQKLVERHNDTPFCTSVPWPRRRRGPPRFSTR